tara:strand:+ start:1570 stop:1851 length:282 start_codon:yes stop_codon:yes gene_type:complete
MQTLVFESLLVGTITSILGNIILKILVKFNSVDKNDSLNPVLNTYKDTYVVPIALFFTGILIHVLLEYIGLNKWYCEKKCIKDRCKIVCEREI